MDYMLLIYGCDRGQPDEESRRAKVAAVNAFVAECRDRGVYRGSDPLQGVDTRQRSGSATARC